MSLHIRRVKMETERARMVKRKTVIRRAKMAIRKAKRTVKREVIDRDKEIALNLGEKEETALILGEMATVSTEPIF